jgi:carboxymethylenebutenolidase
MGFLTTEEESMSEQQWIQDVESLVNARTDEHAGTSRRGVLRGALGVGFAAAVLPVVAQSRIETTHDGLDTEEVALTVDGTSVPVYMARPKGKSNLPVVLVVSEIFGVHEHIADVARRFAHQGYLALAPELFVRQGDPQSYGQIAELMKNVIAKTPDEQVRRDLDACVVWAQENGGDVQRLAITGFCWGGRQVWMYTAAQPLIKAGVAWYGRLEGQATALTPRHPLELAGQLKAPVLGLYGGADTGIPQASVDAMKERLAAAGKAGNRAAGASEFVVYPGVPHAFNADYRASYRQDAAKDGWARCLDWFKKNGVA